MGVFFNNYVKGLIFLTVILPFMSRGECECKTKTFKKNVNICKSLTACSLSVTNDATINGDLTVNGTINGNTSNSTVGPVGPVGPKGPTGDQGNQGTAGVAGPVDSQYAYVYTATLSPVATAMPVPFSATGNLLGFTHIAGSPQIFVTISGFYSINWLISSSDPSTQNIQFEIYINGVPVPPRVSSYTLTDEAGQIRGQCIMQLSAGDIITLVNTSGANRTPTGGFVTASIMIDKVGA